MNPATRERLFGYEQAFVDPVTTGIVHCASGDLGRGVFSDRRAVSHGPHRRKTARRVVGANDIVGHFVPLMLVPIFARRGTDNFRSRVARCFLLFKNTLGRQT